MQFGRWEKKLTRLIAKILISCSFFAAAIACQAAMDPIPCAVGNHWELDCVKLMKGKIEYKGQNVANMFDTRSGTILYDVLSVDNAATPVYSYREATRTRSSIRGRETTEKSEMRITNDAKALKILSTESSFTDDGKSDKQSYDPPLFYFAKDAAPGKSWDVGTIRGESSSEPLSAKAVNRESVTVPAGTFKDCLKVVYTSDTATGTIDMLGQTFTVLSGKTRSVYWIAEGIGVVKELEVSTSTAQSPGPAGGFVTLEASTCTINELKPGYIVK